MSWIKIIAINICVFFVVWIGLEISLGLGRVLLGKKFLLPSIFYSHQISYDTASDPCNEMKTDVLLDHVPNHKGLCKPSGGFVHGEYVVYDNSPQDRPILLTLGGSTTTGFYQFISKEAYPKLLAQLSSEKFFLINGGVGAYSSLQELLKFFRDGPRFNNLKIVVSLNGINELPDYYGYNQERQQKYPFLTEKQYQMNSNQIWIDQRVSSTFLSILKKYLPNTTNLFQFTLDKLPTTLDEGDGLEIDKTKLMLFKTIDAVDRWEKNVTRLNELVQLEGAKYFLFLQPTLGLNGIQSLPKKGSSDEKLYKSLSSSYISEIRDLYKNLKDRCRRLKFCHDISDVAPPKGDFYNDPRHHNSKGNIIIAKHIWKVIEGASPKN